MRNGESRIAVLVLHARRTAQELEPQRMKETKKIDRADEEEIPVQIAAFRIEHWIAARRDVHPFVEMMPQKQNRNEEHRQHRQEQRDVFQLPPNDYRPFRIGRVMNDGPEETAGAEREVKGETEQPGETELPRRKKRADDAQDPRPTTAITASKSEKPAKRPLLEIFAFRRRQQRANDRSFLCCLRCRRGLRFRGFVQIRVMLGGTSAAVAFWLRCSARR